MSPSVLPWWGWLLLAVVLWLAQLLSSAFTYSHPGMYKSSAMGWTVRVILIIGMAISALIGIIRFAKWVWVG